MLNWQTGGQAIWLKDVDNLIVILDVDDFFLSHHCMILHVSVCLAKKKKDNF